MKKHTGFAIAIAWPETLCKQPGAWYDGLLNLLGFSQNHYYKVGHAALVLVERENARCHYFDFGRYHAPFQHGRVRGELTDDGLKMNTNARISGDGQQIENFGEILTELQLNPECHGEGTLHASYGMVNFQQSYRMALSLQQKSLLRYGPFSYKGSNCSRFVNKTIRAGKPALWPTFKLNFLVPLTPTPLNNANVWSNKLVLPKMLPNQAFCPSPIPDKRLLKSTLSEPSRPEHIPASAQWLSGEGSGSWFVIHQGESDHYLVSRFGPLGELECEGEFSLGSQQSFDLSSPYDFEHLSHCQKVSIRQGNKRIEFHRMDT